MYTKAGEKEFLKSCIGPPSCHLTSTGRAAHLAGINGIAILYQNTITILHDDFKISMSKELVN